MELGWVLIVVMAAYGSDGGNAVAMAPFKTKELCEAAGQEASALIKEVRSHRQPGYRCLRSG